MFRWRIAVSLLSLSSAALASDWTVDRVRGEALLTAGAGWQQLVRGQTISDGSSLKTGAGGRVDLSRGNDHFSLGSNTSVEIRDAGADLMTSVIQSAGVVSVDVERRNVQHFSVQTPFLVAVVKGTKFTVISDGNGSHVDVDRGVVQVQDSSNDLVADVRPGQEAGVTAGAPLQVGGVGETPVFTSQGILVSANGNRDPGQGSSTPASSGTVNATPPSTDTKGNSGNGNGNSNNGNGNNGNGGGNSNGSSGSSGNDSNQGNGNSGGNGNGNGNNGNGNGNGGGNGTSNESNGNGGENGNGNGRGHDKNN